MPTTSELELPAEQLFRRYFLPLYAPELRESLDRARTEDANPAGNPRLLEQLDGIAVAFARMAPKLLGDDLVLDYSDASVHHLGARLTRERRDALLTPIQKAGEVPPLVELVIHGTIYLGACVVRNHGGRWKMKNPLWESRVELESRAGVGELALFQWWLKALGDEEIDDPRLADRYRMHVEIPTARPEELPIIAPPDRKLPRLSKVRYDTLHKYLKAHLPELRDVGADFPSPERIDELSFDHLDFRLLGGGRMLLIYGPTDRGAHLMWLDASGFCGSAYYPADAFPAPVVQERGDKLLVSLSVLGSAQTHEMLWWGPTG
ncbi:MAG: hypothetical protein KC731_36385 [Myxococcales bacterium]|nr:hypothetical protein [Myxococcales bacterium]